MIGDTVRYLKDHGKIVIYDAEHAFDGYKDDPEYALATWQAAEKAGADCVVLCDTNGGCLPGEIARHRQAATQQTELRASASTRTTTAASAWPMASPPRGRRDAGAGHDQRLRRAHGQLQSHQRHPDCVAIEDGPARVPPKSLPKLKELSEFVDEIANIRHDPRLPWVGQTAFAHKGGMHVHAIERVARSYEHINPEAVGNAAHVLVSDMSGRTNILMKAQGAWLQAHDRHARSRATSLPRSRNCEAQGYEYEAAEASLALLIRGILDHNPELLFTVDTYHVSMRRDAKESVCEATVRVRVGDKIEHTVAEGDGPVNALDGALRSALGEVLPEAQEQLTLTDYKVRILDGATGTAAKTRVLIKSTDGKREWGTVGVSENIIEASLQALVDSHGIRAVEEVISTTDGHGWTRMKNANFRRWR